MGREIKLNGKMNISYTTFNSGDQTEFQPMKDGDEMPLYKKNFLAIKSDRGFQIRILTDFKMQFVQVQNNHPRFPNETITVFYIGYNRWKKHRDVHNHDVEVIPPENDLPPLLK